MSIKKDKVIPIERANSMAMLASNGFFVLATSLLNLDPLPTLIILTRIPSANPRRTKYKGIDARPKRIQVRIYKISAILLTDELCLSFNFPVR